jgi:hypothetical protein
VRAWLDAGLYAGLEPPRLRIEITENVLLAEGGEPGRGWTRGRPWRAVPVKAARRPACSPAPPLSAVRAELPDASTWAGAAGTRSRARDGRFAVASPGIARARATWE